MFYLILSLALASLVAGVVLLPGYWKFVWVAGWLALLAVLPSLLSFVLDPLNAMRIRKYCSRVGASDVTVEPFPNHYGVHFTKQSVRHYAKCVVTLTGIKWKGKSPQEV